jgi:hypothetical protein
MSTRRHLVFALAGIVFSMGAAQRTPNFVVYAPSAQVAEQVGKWAEHYRKEKAREWLGQEMPNWPQPCPIHVQVTMSGPRGATTFQFAPQGGVQSQIMEISGPLDRLLASVLPHEITHTIFAYYFRCPVPRWADEGGAVLSEDDIELERHNKMVRQILNRGKQIPFRQLMQLKEYPPQEDKVMCLYAQGFSIAHYLVQISNKPTFLQFVAHGMQRGWDSAAQAVYKQRGIDDLEAAWLKHLRETKGMTLAEVAQNKSGASSDPSKQTVVRLTVPPVQPLAPPPVYRGVSGSEQDSQRFGDRSGMTTRPGYLPEFPAGARPTPPTPPGQQPYTPVPVQLGPPQFGPAPVVAPPAPSGFPR